MNDAKRACVAMVCGMLNNKSRSYSSVYDYKRGRHCLFGASNSGKNNIGVYDYDRKGFFQGTVPNFFDYVTSSHMLIREEGEGIAGYDFQSGQFFTATFSNNIISIFDHEFSAYFHYAIM